MLALAYNIQGPYVRTPWQWNTIQCKASICRTRKGQLWVKVFLLFQRVLQLQFHRFRLQLTLTLWHWRKAGRWLKTKTTLMPIPFQINQYILIYRQCTDDLFCVISLTRNCEWYRGSMTSIGGFIFMITLLFTDVLRCLLSYSTKFYIYGSINLWIWRHQE